MTLPRMSDHFGMGECFQNSHGLKLEKLPEAAELRMRFAAENLLEPWRAMVGPIQVNSWFRTQELNDIVGGETNSQHMFGEATDCVPLMMPLRLAFEKLVRSKIEFDQAILYPSRGFIHVSIKSGDRAERLPNRRQTLQSDSKGKYIVYR
jgi:hypothetical protein